MVEFGLTLIPASDLPYERLAFLINYAYADYYLPVWMSEAQFESMCQRDDVDLSLSVVAVADEMPVGITLLSHRDSRGWVSGVGVLPAWRRRGIAHRMMRKIQTNARELRLENLWLEVLTQNEAGATLYKHLGFTWVRDLLMLTLEASLLDPKPPHASVSEADPAALLEYYERFHDVPPPWQREFSSLHNRLSMLRGLVYQDAGVSVGYLLYSPHLHYQAIWDVAVQPSHPDRLSVARALLRTLHSLYPANGSHIINFPAEDPLLSAFTGLRYRIWQRQHELICPVQ